MSTSDCCPDHEDQWILDQFPAGYLGTAIEIGANDGVFLSNTLRLEHLGWTVLCIEPSPEHTPALKRNRRLVLECACLGQPSEPRMLYTNPADRNLTGFSATGLPQVQEGVPVAMVNISTIDLCLRQAGFTRLDALSIDVDGEDLAVLKGARIDHWRPRVLVVETVIHGSYAHKTHITDYLEPLGYNPVGQTTHNTLYLNPTMTPWLHAA